MNSAAFNPAKVAQSDYQLALTELTTAMPLRKIVDRIERMDVSADAKAFLKDLASISVKIGDTLVHVGRKIIDFAMDLAARFPNTVFGVMIGLLVMTLIALVPAIGAAMAVTVGPLLVAFGLTKGALADMHDSAVKQRIREIEMQFAVVQSKS